MRKLLLAAAHKQARVLLRPNWTLQTEHITNDKVVVTYGVTTNGRESGVEVTTCHNRSVWEDGVTTTYRVF